MRIENGNKIVFIPPHKDKILTGWQNFITLRVIPQSTRATLVKKNQNDRLTARSLRKVF